MLNPAIAICLPSKNEEKSIGHVVRTIDDALCDLGDTRNHLIVNVDSSSEDQTVSIFQQTPTKCKKISLRTVYGKGGNLFEFLKFTSAHNFDIFGMFDTDVTSLTSDWVVKMAEKILQQNANYVVPFYRRSPFEGSVTNHFCFPLLYGLSGKLIRQPIAGDFMFNACFAKNVLNNLLQSPINETFGYGIDIFLTLTALNDNFNIEQVALDKKIHNPSYNKIEIIFHDVANTFLNNIMMLKSITQFSRTENLDCNLANYNSFIFQKQSIMHENFGRELQKNYMEKAVQNKNIYKSIFKSDFFWLEYFFIKEHLNKQTWSIILTKFVSLFIENKIDKASLLNYITPLFICRAVSHWTNAKIVSEHDSEQEILDQAILVRNALCLNKIESEALQC